MISKAPLIRYNHFHGLWTVFLQADIDFDDDEPSIYLANRRHDMYVTFKDALAIVVKEKGYPIMVRYVEVFPEDYDDSGIRTYVIHNDTEAVQLLLTLE
jgi:hypothetical protein